MGVTALSGAAAIQSAVYGSAVGSGSVFAAMQSIGMAGASASTVLASAGVGAGIGNQLLPAGSGYWDEACVQRELGAFYGASSYSEL